MNSTKFLMKYGRLAVYIASAFIALGIYISILSTISSPTLRNIRLTEWYGFASVIFLYISLLISPLYFSFPFFPFRAALVHTRRATGITAFLFAALHSAIGFFTLLGGFDGLAFLNTRYILDLILSSCALLILFLMAATSFDFFVTYLGPYWKKLHRFVYLVGLLILIHILTIGSHFTNLGNSIPLLFLILFGLLISLELFRFNNFLRMKLKYSRRIGSYVVTGLLVALFAGIYILIMNGHSLHVH